MYAVVSTGGKQLKVEKSTVAVIEKLDAEVGETVSLPVLLVADGETVVAGRSAWANAQVSGTVVGHVKGDKQVVFKFKKRKGYKRTKGHRQLQTLVEITDIVIGTPVKKAAPKKAEPKEAAPKKSAPKQAEPAAIEEPTLVEPVASESPGAQAPVAEAAEGQCAAMKADGTRCANKAKEGSAYCGVHAKKCDA